MGDVEATPTRKEILENLISAFFSREWMIQYLPLLLFPVLLVLIHYLTPSLKDYLKFVPANPIWYAYFTNAFVHQDASHLWGNVWMFLFATLTLLYVGRKLNRLKGFYIVSAVLIIGTPIFLSFYELANPSTQPAASFGSSGIVTAFVAFLPAFILLLIGIKNYWYYLSYLVLASVLSIFRMKFWRYEILTFLVLFIAHGLLCYLIFRKGTWKPKLTPTNYVQKLGDIVVVFCFAFIMPFVLYSLFSPSVDLVAQTRTNLLAHFGALIIGLAVGSVYFSLTHGTLGVKESNP